MDAAGIAALLAQEAPEFSEEDRVAIVRELMASGATGDQIVAAAREGRIGALGLEVVFRRGRSRDFEALVKDLGATPEEIALLLMALGFADPRNSRSTYDEGMRDALAFLLGATELFPREAGQAFVRTVGAEASRLAEVIVALFRAEIEAPSMRAGTRYADVIRGYSEAAQELLPPFLDAFGATLRQHILRAAAGQWSYDEATGVTRSEVAVGFVDLVGYTSLSNASTGAMVRAIGLLEVMTADVAARHGGRIVKLIGDSAMFVVNDPSRGAELALDLGEACRSSSELPPVRIAVAAGTVATVNGDYYGDVVNLAARLVAVAKPGSVVASAAVAELAADDVSASELPARALKGFDAPIVAYAIERRE